MKFLKNIWASFFVLGSTFLCAQTAILDSGGPLTPEQAAYDVSFYDLNVKIMPDTRELEGQVIVRAKVVQPMNQLVLDLDTLLTIREVWDLSNPQKPVAATYTRKVGKIWIDLGFTRQAGGTIPRPRAHRVPDGG